MELSEKEINTILEEYAKAGGDDVKFARKVLTELLPHYKTLDELSEAIIDYYTDELLDHVVMNTRENKHSDLEYKKLELEQEDNQYKLEKLSHAVKSIISK